ncbi:MAG: type II toxin-antitoxin system RelE/ParE family toxin [Nitrospira sp.]
MKRLVWLGASLGDLRSWPVEAQRDTGYQLFKIQSGLDPSDWKSMPSVGSGVQEIRIRCGNEYRVIYLAKLAHAVYVLHAFEKKTRKTPQAALDVARRRLQLLRIERKRA